MCSSDLHPITSSLGLAYPILLIVNTTFLALFLMFKKLYVIIPVLGFVVCYIPTRTYSPINIPHSTPDDAIKVMSYNVFMYNRNNENGLQKIAEYVNGSGAAIVCMQESDYNKEVHDIFSKEYQYIDTARNAAYSDVQMILSKYPILSKTHINTDLRGCVCAAYEVLINGDRTTVINCHFEGSGLSPEDRQEFKRMVKGEWKKETVGTDSKRMIVNLGESAKRRLPQIRSEERR